MVEIAGGRLQPVGNVPHGVTAGKLAEYHADEPAPCVVALAMFVAPTLIDDFPNFFFR